MIGLILIYIVGKSFYDLAWEYKKNQWLFAFLGVVSYYAGSTLAEFVLLVLSELEFISVPDFGISLLAVPIGLLSCWGTYTLLKNKWGAAEKVSEETLDGELIK